jgi:phosphoglycolate phosphatase
VDDAEAEQALALFMDAYAESHELTVVYPGVRDTLRWLRKQGVEMALITNKPERFVAPAAGPDEDRPVLPLDHRRRHPAAEEARPGGAVVRDEDGQCPPRSRCSSAIRAVTCWRRKRLGCSAWPELRLQPWPADRRGIAHLVIDDLRAAAGCLDPATGITLPDLQAPLEIPSWWSLGKLWMKVIKALARWRWRA